MLCGQAEGTLTSVQRSEGQTVSEVEQDMFMQQRPGLAVQLVCKLALESVSMQATCQALAPVLALSACLVQCMDLRHPVVADSCCLQGAACSWL